MPDETPPPTDTPVNNDAPPPETPWEARVFDPASPGKLVEKWQELLPAELEDAKHMLADYGDFKTILRSLKDNKTKAREKAGVKPITAESTPEQIAAYRREMGIPDTPYEFQKPEQLPEGIEWREERIKQFGEWAQKEHLTPAQAKKALDLHLQFLSEDHNALTAAEKAIFEKNHAEEQEHLRVTHGGKLAGVVNNAQRIALKYNLPPEIAEPTSPRFAGATMLQMMSDLAGALGESKIPSAAAVHNMNPEREYKAIVGDKSHPLHALWAKGDKVTLAKVAELRRQALQSGAA